MLRNKPAHGHVNQSGHLAQGYPRQYHGYPGVMFTPPVNNVPAGHHPSHTNTTTVVSVHSHPGHNPPHVHHHSDQGMYPHSGRFPRF
ncbi:hypothetical protein [Legionella clemsonensis]|uniref:Uncharacterized protein n=1 Tax=Legionella clemsonensis TaxID=1867846 RepID=A0A222P2V8_9GAMM|nr:hypothetical protein [Legionella clemsonensis]ASQ46161.1 hypothetical protein clem_08045 [Legionella clemsonensis]